MISELPERTNSLVLSFMSIRRAIGLSGILLPVVLGPIGWLVFGIEFQDNMSSYYHTGMRDVFVGTLCAIGIFLYCYRGYDWIEHWTANIGCLSALGIAFFPLDPNSDPLFQRTWTGYLHTLSGGAFFLTLAFYSLYHFPTADEEKHETAPHEALRNFIYRTSGLVIVLSVLAMGAHIFVLPPDWKQFLNRYNFLFWTEWIALWAFASAWLTKGRAMVAEIAVELLAIPTELISQRKAK